jgi:hypothetical protein
MVVNHEGLCIVNFSQSSGQVKYSYLYGIQYFQLVYVPPLSDVCTSYVLRQTYSLVVELDLARAPTW